MTTQKHVTNFQEGGALTPIGFIWLFPAYIAGVAVIVGYLLATEKHWREKLRGWKGLRVLLWPLLALWRIGKFVWFLVQLALDAVRVFR